MYRSEHILKGLSNQYYRATYKSMGFTTDDLKRPIIGIANAWSECVPGHYNLRQVAQRVKDGIYRAGGTPIEFGVIGGCDGMGQGHDGMHFIMPSRELIANSIESMAQINLFDGLVLLGSCDKIVPGMLMAAARLDIPCIFLPGGPMEGGVEFDGRQADQTSSTEAYGMLSAGKITEEEYVSLENTACPGCGSCSYLGTANTMCALAEAMGLTLPDGGTGALSGIISNSGLKDVIISFIETLGLPGFMLAPISGMLMGAATASATAGTTLASQIFGPTVVASGVTPLAAAAMTHASCFVFDGLPHGSFFHVSAGGVNMEISERLKLLGYEAINGLAMMAVSTLVFGVLKLAG